MLYCEVAVVELEIPRKRCLVNESQNSSAETLTAYEEAPMNRSREVVLTTSKIYTLGIASTSSLSQPRSLEL